ncbi:hypothetical protein KBK19_10845 [Microvirga sp. STR05]|uniref:Uncharacterized protein n=2 Tax=Hymenobacter TaxID=89966 RepID=A0A7G7W4K8_9BACT|nr:MULTISPECIES: hypothetical protein [Hymenobacter]MBD2715534.1 hypothetical protein [Hymenobacter duratus]MBR7950442.1 hypothetical protein [Microvirga sp. STR05]QNH61301.1 hypothetical protein H4317_14180 [Hymenobacter sediminicola]
MPVPSAEFKKALKRLPDAEKEKLLLRAVRRDAELYETFVFELLPDVTTEQVYEQAADRIHELFNVAVTGRLLNRSLNKALGKAVKETARARRITKDKRLEIDLNLYALRLIFDNYTGQFDSPYAGFFTSTARLAARTTQLVLTSLHEDLWLEYKPELDDFLTQLHGRSKSRSLKFELPRELVLPD